VLTHVKKKEEKAPVNGTGGLCLPEVSQYRVMGAGTVISTCFVDSHSGFNLLSEQII
jgi:hypothetical protein